MNIPALLDTLSEYEAQRDSISLRKQEAVDLTLTPEIREKLAEIDGEFDRLYEPVNQRIAELTDEIKTAVLEHGASVKGQYRQAVYAKGVASWDTKALDGYAVAHPEILPFRTVGAPRVSLRTTR